jgi:hypothetical protein
MKATRSSETYFYNKPTQRHIPEGDILQSPTLKPQIPHSNEFKQGLTVRQIRMTIPVTSAFNRNQYRKINLTTTCEPIV